MKYKAEPEKVEPSEEYIKEYTKLMKLVMKDNILDSNMFLNREYINKYIEIHKNELMKSSRINENRVDNTLIDIFSLNSDELVFIINIALIRLPFMAISFVIEGLKTWNSSLLEIMGDEYLEKMLKEFFDKNLDKDE